MDRPKSGAGACSALALSGGVVVVEGRVSGPDAEVTLGPSGWAPGAAQADECHGQPGDEEQDGGRCDAGSAATTALLDG